MCMCNVRQWQDASKRRGRQVGAGQSLSCVIHFMYRAVACVGISTCSLQGATQAAVDVWISQQVMRGVQLLPFPVQLANRNA